MKKVCLLLTDAMVVFKMLLMLYLVTKITQASNNLSFYTFPDSRLILTTLTFTTLSKWPCSYYWEFYVAKLSSIKLSLLYCNACINTMNLHGQKDHLQNMTIKQTDKMYKKVYHFISKSFLSTCKYICSLNFIVFIHVFKQFLCENKFLESSNRQKQHV